MDENNFKKAEKSTDISNDNSMNTFADDVKPETMEQLNSDLINEVNETIMKNEMNMF